MICSGRPSRPECQRKQVWELLTRQPWNGSSSAAHWLPFLLLTPDTCSRCILPALGILAGLIRISLPDFRLPPALVHGPGLHLGRELSVYSLFKEQSLEARVTQAKTAESGFLPCLLGFPSPLLSSPLLVILESVEITFVVMGNHFINQAELYACHSVL